MIVGFCNGCFDLFHAGHSHFLRLAKLQCDVLMVAINSDDSIRELKGEGRPIMRLHERMHWVAVNTYFGDPIVYFDDERRLRRIIATFKPDIIFKGSDYDGKEVVGSDLARVVLIPRLPGFSTTAEIEKRRA